MLRRKACGRVGVFFEAGAGVSASLTPHMLITRVRRELGRTRRELRGNSMLAFEVRVWPRVDGGMSLEMLERIDGMSVSAISCSSWLRRRFRFSGLVSGIVTIGRPMARKQAEAGSGHLQN